ncbi:FosX/FosE/FosI family fosfomycin resistance hydrolase [Agromyces mariniharenae]|uniref:FosX/FosE/FosI family fosfomycin resistance thiol transferase n=1 Tax=Agromyces mariniharenae TaxID=2604423 RepID=A0A5S4VFN4_9MICO|nr:FosX/FosE/FosI family fosfomycin resistance hydrolase [Agromyces mariniharenae]TYL52855.1 FosX/FosE/FosI family fosfomycin resistance thiol transferase [Agromyces mariniharenae]
MSSSGLSHVTFIVRDLDRMEQVLVAVLGAVRVYDSGSDTFSLSEERFFLIGEGDAATWVAIMQGDTALPRTYNHVAFHVRRDDLPALRETITGLGLDVRPPRSRVEGEGDSIYFHDHDGHLFELHAGSLRGRLAVYSTAASSGDAVG